MWRLDKNWKALRMTSPWLDRPPSDIIQDRVMLNTQALEEPARGSRFRALLDMFDAESTRKQTEGRDIRNSIT